MTGGAARVLMTGSRDWTNEQTTLDALNAALALLGATPSLSVLVHGDAVGADRLVAHIAERIGMTGEAHPAKWDQHANACPEWDKPHRTCKLAGHRRNAEMIMLGADVCLAFPTHGYHLAPGEDRTRTSRGTWNCAEKAKEAGLPTLVVWGQHLFPFGAAGAQLLAADADRKGLRLGAAGELPLMEAWLPF